MHQYKKRNITITVFIYLLVYLFISEYFYIHDDLGLFWITGKTECFSLETFHCIQKHCISAVFLKGCGQKLDQ